LNITHMCTSDELTSQTTHRCPTPTSTSITTLTQASAVAKPFNIPNGGTFSQNFTFHILCSTSGATIYYTLDGSTPTTSSSVYPTGDGILLSGAGTKTVKAIGVKTGLSNSAIATATFQIQ